jgi:hypothetical protein
LKVAEEACKKCDDLKMEYIKKINDNQNNEFMKGRAAEWLIDSIIRIN